MIIGSLALVLVSNLFLQWCQNDLSIDLAVKFAFSWHTEKFLLGCFVLLAFLVFLISLAGSFAAGSLFYAIIIGILGFADYLKMSYRMEPIYPDDLKMISELGLLREMVGTGPFVVILLIAIVGIGLMLRSLYRSLRLPRKLQMLRVAMLVLSIGLLSYTSDFNNPNNLLRQAYNKTALWIPYSQKMNYYNTGFIGGFLYNLKVEVMPEPEGYSEARVKEIVDKYQTTEEKSTEKPNIIFVMSESFSDPQLLNGLTVNQDPLKDYYEVANKTYSGRMLSQNYGGGTANIEFEALTGFSMEPLNAQMTTPYTMLVPKMEQIPSIVSLLKGQDYQTTAIHPYNTSMYKRQDVYQILGFDQFLDEDTMKHTEKLEHNPYISDKAAYEEILELLAKKDPQFVHLVTMQTHMPYGSKYDTDIQVTGDSQANLIADYLQDIAYSSEALKNFLQQLDQLDRRTLVVFWGDHLPSIYSDELQAQNDESVLHETSFLMYDTQHELTQQQVHDALISPVYFAPQLFRQSGLQETGFYKLLLDLEKALPAFEKGYYYRNGWHAELSLNAADQATYDEYAMIQYDIVAGKQYSMDMNFFE